MAYASKLKTKNQGNVPIGSNLFGICTTASATVQKEVSLSDFDVLTEGVTVHVHMANDNSATDPTLKVGSTGAKSIVGDDWDADTVVAFTYHNNKWWLNGGGGGSVSYREEPNSGGGTTAIIE